MSLPLLLAALPSGLVITVSVSSGLLVGAIVFLVLFLRSRPPKMIQRITVTKGSAAGQGVPVMGRVRIGRDAGNEFAIADEELSRYHCEIRTDTGYAILIDNNSANGTRVNGKPVQSTALRAGDEISIGAQILRCS